MEGRWRFVCESPNSAGLSRNYCDAQLKRYSRLWLCGQRVALTAVCTAPPDLPLQMSKASTIAGWAFGLAFWLSLSGSILVLCGLAALQNMCDGERIAHGRRLLRVRSDSRRACHHSFATPATSPAACCNHCKGLIKTADCPALLQTYPSSP